MRQIDADRLLEERRIHTYYHLPNGDIAIPLIDIKNAPTIEPSAQPEPDWDYSEETKQITLIVPEDVYNSAETIFLSVGYEEGAFGIRGRVYYTQPERKKGKWVPIICTSDGKHHEWCGYQCSICGERTLRLMRHNFCPNCGSDMREEGERNETD